MKKATTLLLLALFLITGINSCKKETTTHNPADDYKVTVFNNQSGNPSADALQAQIVNTKDNYQINIYGSFLGNNSPDQINTVTYHKDGNDTLVDLILDPTTHKLQTAFTEVNGVKQRWVIKHEYIPGNDSAIIISVYDYDWTANTSVLKFQSRFETHNGVRTETPIYSSFKTNDLFGVGAIAAGLVVAEAAFYGTGIGFLGTAAGAALVGAAGTVVAVGAAVAVITAAVAVVTSSSANASELTPGNNPLPTNTPTNNPTTGNNNPTPNLPPSPCSGVNITFTQGMDSQGSIAINLPTGGTAPYMYALGFPLNFQASQFFIGAHANGSYQLTVKDANGCTASKVAILHHAPVLDSVTDFEGNVYHTIAIGNHVWTQENLRSTIYSDGTPIPQVEDSLLWGQLTTPGWCNIYHNPGNTAVYGKMYNWYVGADPHNACPVGWHVATAADYNELFNDLGGSANAYTGITSVDSFAAKFSGYRYPNLNCSFVQAGNWACYWTSNEQDAANGVHYILHYLTDNSATDYWLKTAGMSLRCVKN